MNVDSALVVWCHTDGIVQILVLGTNIYIYIHEIILVEQHSYPLAVKCVVIVPPFVK